MSDSCTIWLAAAEITAQSGKSLKNSLYTFPLDLLLTGELGAGKTTFLQGFAKSLGIDEGITSPTYALEQRYRTSSGREFLHIDLYRLKSAEAAELLVATSGHTGIRSIEWADRSDHPSDIPSLSLSFREHGNGRELTCIFRDIPLPSREQILEWRSRVLLPSHIARHCDAVASFAENLARALHARGMIVRPLALRRAGELHDLLRFIDFRDGAGPAKAEHSEEQHEVFKKWKRKYAGLRHEPACAAFLREEGFSALSTIVEPHGLALPSPERTTIEQKLLFYADKRVNIDRVVSLEERFNDFQKRYGGGDEFQKLKIWFEEAKRVEMELFPEGIPS